MAGVLGLAVAEWAASALAYREQLTASDWDAAAEALAPIATTPEPVFLADPWLGPVARSKLAVLSHVESLAPASLHGARTFHVLGLGDRAWSAELQSDLEELDPPREVERRRLGNLTLTTYTLATDRLVHDFTRDTPTVVAGGVTCRGEDLIRCNKGRIGRVQRKIVEVDYRPRSCFEVDLADGVEATLTLPASPRADVYLGHVGFSDYNGRLRSDAPAVITLERGDERLGRWLATDEEGWKPLSVEVTPSAEPITVTVQTAVRGTWDRKGYQSNKTRPVCFELRGFSRGAR